MTIKFYQLISKANKMQKNPTLGMSKIEIAGIRSINILLSIKIGIVRHRNFLAPLPLNHMPINS